MRHSPHLLPPREILEGRIYYTADTHVGHANIIAHCARPFGSVAAMDAFLLRELELVDAGGAHLVHAGDLDLEPETMAARWPAFLAPEHHTAVAGNHDGLDTPEAAERLAPWFGTVVGLTATWRTHGTVVCDTLHGRPVRVLVSHEPQADLRGCDLNVYGHHHNNMTRRPQDYPAYAWLLESERHANAGVELWDYRPVLLDELFAAARSIV